MGREEDQRRWVEIELGVVGWVAAIGLLILVWAIIFSLERGPFVESLDEQGPLVESIDEQGPFVESIDEQEPLVEQYP